jgi:hypothetical protein
MNWRAVGKGPGVEVRWWSPRSVPALPERKKSERLLGFLELAGFETEMAKALAGPVG